MSDAKQPYKQQPPAYEPGAAAKGDAKLGEGDYVLVPRSALQQTGSFAAAASAAGAGDAKAAAVKSKVSAAARMVRAVGLKEITLTIPMEVAIVNTNANAADGSFAIFPDQNGAEWAALIALYDEYKVLGGTFDFATNYLGATLTNASGQQRPQTCVGYDPVDGQVPSSAVQVAELAQHVDLYPVIFQDSVTASNARPVFMGRHSLKWTTQRSKALSVASGAITAATDEWLQTLAAGSNVPCGYFKCFGTAWFTAASLPCISGLNYIRMKFRSRK